MESMRTAPKSRDEGDPETRTQQGQNQMFLPSENPTGEILIIYNLCQRTSKAYTLYLYINLSFFAISICSTNELNC